MQFEAIPKALEGIPKVRPCLRITILAAEKARVELLPGDSDSGESIIWVVIQEGVVKTWRKPRGPCANKQGRAAGY